MKKLLSIILALVTLLSVTTVMAGATEADLAQTCATYYVSSTPFEDVANANIIGYLGDLNGDKDISIRCNSGSAFACKHYRFRK